MTTFACHVLLNLVGKRIGSVKSTKKLRKQFSDLEQTQVLGSQRLFDGLCAVAETWPLWLKLLTGTILIEHFTGGCIVFSIDNVIQENVSELLIYLKTCNF